MLQVDVNLRKNKFLNIKKSPLLLKDISNSGDFFVPIVKKHRRIFKRHFHDHLYKKE